MASLLTTDHWQDLSVTRFDSDYVPQGTWGNSGTGAGEFDRAIHLAVDESRSVVFVSDEGHDQIHFFTLAGTYVGSWGSSGDQEGQFSAPGGLALDSEGYLYVADRDNSRVQKLEFARNAFTVVATWSSSSARDIAIYEDQVIVLSDDSVSVYERR